VEVKKKGDRVMLSIMDLVFRQRLMKKLTERYMEPYVIEEIVYQKCSEFEVTGLYEDSSGS